MLDFSVTFGITIVNIVILFFILRAILFKPVTKFMESRAKKVQDSIEEAERSRNEAKSLLTQYETRLKNAEAEAASIVQTAREQARAETGRILAEGKSQAETLLMGAKKQIEAEQQAALLEFRKEAALLVTMAAGRLAARDFGSRDNRQYAEMLLNEMAGTAHV